MIRLCFTNLWLKLKTSDGEKKERGSCSVACFASLNVNKPYQKLKSTIATQILQKSMTNTGFFSRPTLRIISGGCK